MRLFAAHRVAAVTRPTRRGGDRAKLPRVLTFVAAASIPRVQPDADFLEAASAATVNVFRIPDILPSTTP